MNSQHKMSDAAAMTYLADLDRIASRGLITVQEKAAAARENCTTAQLERYAAQLREREPQPVTV